MKNETSAQTPRVTKDRIIEALAVDGDYLHPREIAGRLDLPETQYEMMVRMIEDMLNQGALQLRGKKVRLDPRAVRERASDARDKTEGKRSTLTGILTVNPRGFGFVKLDAGSSKEQKDRSFDGGDIFIPEESLGGAMHGDSVEVRVIGRSARGAEGRIEKIASRGRARVVGTLRRRRDEAWVEPDDQRVRGPIALPNRVDTRGAEGNSGNDGDAVVVRITRFPEYDGEHPEGTIEAVLGRPGELSVEVRKIIAMADIHELHGEGAVRMAESFGAEVPKQMLEGRTDLTHLPLPTIDPEDARDHDDAVWVERSTGGGYLAWIAIADVSSYVTPETPLDEEAKGRGCSLYLPDRAIPMLPRALSSNLCSLLPNVVRLCLCCKVQLDAEGKVLGVDLIRGYMNSRAKLTYGGVARTLGLTEAGPVVPDAEALKPGLQIAYELSRALRARRRERGALDFDLPEAKFQLDGEGKPIGVEKRGADPGVKRAYELIEELMILANECVATWLIERNVPTVFRVHAAPDETKIDKLAAMCEHLGIPFEAEETKTPRTLAKLLTRFSTHELSHVLNNLLLRSMKQAVYDTENIGHFGLASEAYAHFTSPIRRYPDVVVHRQVHRLVTCSGEKPDKAVMQESAVQSSLNERRAMEVERDVADLYKAMYMRDRVGERFTGIISAVTGGGLFITLESPFVDVFMKYEDVGDGFGADEDGLRCRSSDTGEAIQLGDAIGVEVTDVSITRRTTYARRFSEASLGANKPRRLPRVADTRTSARAGGGHSRPQRGGKPNSDRRDGGSSDKRGGKFAKAGAKAAPAVPAKGGKPGKPAKPVGRDKAGVKKKQKRSKR